ncbi:MAG: mechanosensitive ion channel [Ignavibacteriae bacterium]|nr:mechanosensitive ion channel [Ignavibacteriota bacterium]MCB9244194.1 mechanosensitive ion channel [Ignavibacteriales bacterium]
MGDLAQIVDSIKDFLSIHLFNIGTTNVTLWLVLNILFFLVLLVFFTGKLKKWILELLQKRSHITPGVGDAIATIVRYLFVIIGLVIILQTMGIDLSSLVVLAGALGVGLGFGLQNIVNNLISGIIILFERPIKLGDRVVVGEVEGNVTAINIRATTVVTNSNVAIIIPNSEFISAKVTNLSYTDDKIRFDIPVGVGYSSDINLVRKALLEVAAEEPGILPDPPPKALFLEFGDFTYNFVLRVWTSEYLKTPKVFRSLVNFKMWQKFKDYNIEVPFPQRDLHLRSGVLPIVKGDETPGDISGLDDSGAQSDPPQNKS